MHGEVDGSGGQRGSIEHCDQGVGAVVGGGDAGDGERGRIDARHAAGVGERRAVQGPLVGVDGASGNQGGGKGGARVHLL